MSDTEISIAPNSTNRMIVCNKYVVHAHSMAIGTSQEKPQGAVLASVMSMAGCIDILMAQWLS